MGTVTRDIHTVPTYSITVTAVAYATAATEEIASDVAARRIVCASARTMAAEIAARWCGKKDLGDARLVP